MTKDLTKIKAGDTLILRNGGREVCVRTDGGYIAAHNLSWSTGGKWYAEETGLDIIDYEPAPEKKEYSGSIYWVLRAGQVIPYAHYSPTNDGCALPPDAMVIAITPVTFKEGEGI